MKHQSKDQPKTGPGTKKHSRMTGEPKKAKSIHPKGKHSKKD